MEDPDWVPDEKLELIRILEISHYSGMIEIMFTALERGRAYRLRGETWVFEERIFEPDLPAQFIFRKQGTEERIALLIEQLTAMEADGELRYMGLIPESM